MKIISKTNCHAPKELTLGALAQNTKAELHGDPNIKIHGVGTILQAKSGDISFVSEAKYAKFIPRSKASALILTEKEFNAFPINAGLICKDPKVVYAKVVELLYPYQALSCHIHESALIAKSAQIHPHCHIGPHCVIKENVKIGQNVVIGANTVIEEGCEIGDFTVINPNVTIYHHCIIGNHCHIHSGAVIGSDGFGFAHEQGKWLKIGQIGGVKIGDRVEIGANTTIDRGTIEDTQIGSDVILDNLIQIGHNVKIGQGTAIAAKCGIAGSAHIGKYCLIGGGTGIVGHITIADFVSIVPGSNVGQSIASPGAYASGLTTTEMKTWKRNLVRFHQLDALANRLIALERKLKETDVGR